MTSETTDVESSEFEPDKGPSKVPEGKEALRAGRKFQSFASGTVLLSWGIALSLFPSYAGLDSTWTLWLRIISGVLYVLGFIMFLSSASEISSRLTTQALIFGVGAVGVLLTLHVLSTLVERRVFELIFKVSGLILLCFFLVGAIMKIPELVAAPDSRGDLLKASGSSASTKSGDQLTEASSRERGTELAIAAISLVVAIVELGRVVID